MLANFIYSAGNDSKVILYYNFYVVVLINNVYFKLVQIVEIIRTKFISHETTKLLDHIMVALLTKCVTWEDRVSV